MRILSLTDDLLKTADPKSKTRIEVNPEGAEVSGATFETAQPAARDWAEVFQQFKLDPDEFEIVDDTVRMSTWQQSARTAGGDRDLIQLYSFSARFTRRREGRLPDLEVEARREALRSFNPPPAVIARSKPRVGAVINLSDLQSGKVDGGGVKALERRLQDGLENVQAWLSRSRDFYDVREIVLVNNGDPIEGCGGHYAQQLFTVELNYRQQMNFALDAWEMYARALYPQAPEGQFVSVLCNHGEFGRFGAKKNQTDDADNAGGFLAETLQRVLEGHPSFDHINWTIPHEEMNVYTDVQGVPMGFNHGHKISGKDARGFETWLNSQVRGDEQAHRARIWQTAHRHHFQAWDLGSCTGFQAPTLDGGSKSFRDATGRYSNSGILAYLVGEHTKLGWSDLAFL